MAIKMSRNFMHYCKELAMIPGESIVMVGIFKTISQEFSNWQVILNGSAVSEVEGHE
jgi:hypothetical protein